MYNSVQKTHIPGTGKNPGLPLLIDSTTYIIHYPAHFQQLSKPISSDVTEFLKRDVRELSRRKIYIDEAVYRITHEGTCRLVPGTHFCQNISVSDPDMLIRWGTKKCSRSLGLKFRCIVGTRKFFGPLGLKSIFIHKGGLP